MLHPTGLEETLSVGRIMDDAHVRAAGGAAGLGAGEYSDLLRLQAQMREKLQLMLSYKRFTAMDPATRLHTVHKASSLVRTTQIEIARNEMFALLQQFS